MATNSTDSVLLDLELANPLWGRWHADHCSDRNIIMPALCSQCCLPFSELFRQLSALGAEMVEMAYMAYMAPSNKSQKVGAMSHVWVSSRRLHNGYHKFHSLSPGSWILMCRLQLICLATRADHLTADGKPNEQVVFVKTQSSVAMCTTKIIYTCSLAGAVWYLNGNLKITLECAFLFLTTIIACVF